jgi:hypothetical protein
VLAEPPRGDEVEVPGHRDDRMRYGLVPDLYGQPAVLHGRLTTLHLASDGT